MSRLHVKFDKDYEAIPVETQHEKGFARKWLKYFNWLFENVGETIENLELNEREYTLISLIHLVNLEHIIKLINYIWRNGAGVTIVAYIFITIFISMPIYMIFMFMASYSKKTYIVFWDCVPLMRGLGYIYALISIPDTFSIVSYGGNALGFIYQYMKNANTVHEKCSAKPSCVTKNYFQTYKQCKRRNYTFPMLHLVKQGIEAVGKEERVSILIGKVSMVFIMFVIAAKGLNKIRKVIMFIQTVMIIIFAFSFLVTLLKAPIFEKVPPYLVSNWASLWNRNFWLQMVLELSQMTEIGNLIWLSTFTPRSIRLDSFIMYLHFIKIFVVLTAVIWVSIIYRSLNNMFNMDMATCCRVIGIELAFAASTEIFIRLEINKVMVILWFTAFAILQVLTASYRLMSLVDSIVDAHKKYMGRYKFAVKVVFLFIFLILVVVFNTKDIIYGLVDWSIKGRNLVFAFIFFFTLIGINYIYSIDRLLNDFHFTYGDIPDKLWIIAWKALSVIAMLDLVYIVMAIFESIKSIVNHPETAKIIHLMVPLIIIVPCIIVFITTCLKSISRHSFLSATAPNERWGPYEDTTDRLLFVPTRDLKYRRTKVMCNHACLLNANSWRQEVAKQKNKIQEFIHIMDKHWDKMSVKLKNRRSEILGTIDTLTVDLTLEQEFDLDEEKRNRNALRKISMF